jgi:hypothetical protein
MEDLPPLRIFVAMPGTDMGANAYKNPESVKANLLQPVVERVKERLGRELKLSIEKDKRQAGVIHEYMFAEARDADVLNRRSYRRESQCIPQLVTYMARRLVCGCY